MKFTTALPIAVIAATSSPVVLAANIRESVAKGSEVSAAVDDVALSRPGRQLKKARGKKRFPATPEDYDWILGEYYPMDPSIPVDYYQVHLEHGEPTDLPASYYPAKLEIKPLRDDVPSLIFQATLTHKINGTDMEAVDVMEGVGSLNPARDDQIIFYSDHEFYRNSTDGTMTSRTRRLTGDDYPQGSQAAADVTTMLCSLVPGYPDGENIVCDSYGQTHYGPEYPIHAEGISTMAWAESIF